MPGLSKNLKSFASTILVLELGCSPISTSMRGFHYELSENIKVSHNKASPDKDILELGSEPRAWLKTNFPITKSPDLNTFKALVQAISPNGELGLKYEELGIYTANETWRHRSGNCLSFTNLFVAMGRALGMNVRYREVISFPEKNRKGEYLVSYRHIMAYVEIDGEKFHVDFGGDTYSDDSIGFIIEDSRAKAQHFSNLGAAALIDQREEDAIKYLFRALLIDQQLSYAWTNLGTLYLRRGNLARAEQALKTGLKFAPNNLGILRQLMRFYQHVGDKKLTKHYKTQLQLAQLNSPMAKYESGITALALGNTETAILKLRMAVKELPSIIRIRLYLSQAYLGAGQWRAARRTLRAAFSLAQSQADMMEITEVLSQVAER